MKRIYLMFALIMLISVNFLLADKLKIYRSDGTSEEFLLSEINRIETKNLTENYQMSINKRDGDTIKILLRSVEKIIYNNDNLLVYIAGNPTSYNAIDILNIEFKIVEQYETVTIGTQVWMLKNLDVSKYRNGDTIRYAASNEDWIDAGNKEEGAWCYYNNDAANGETYGKLYNWYAVNDARGLAPSGYHVASDAEWTSLENYLKSNSQYWCNNDSSYIAKSLAAKERWITYNRTCVIGNNLNANNSSGFSALPGGYIYISGIYRNITINGMWWSSTEYDEADALSRFLAHASASLDRYRLNKVYGCSVRCLRD